MIKRYTIGLLVAAVALLGGCAGELDEMTTTGSDIRLTEVHVAADGGMTRAADAAGYEGMVKTTWVDGDEIALTLGDFTGKVRHYYLDENNKGWKIYDADGAEVSEIVFPEEELWRGLALEARYTGRGATKAEQDLLLVKGIYRRAGAEISIGMANIHEVAGILDLRLAHAKSYIAVNLANQLAGDAVTKMEVVLRDAAGAALPTPVAMTANDGMTRFECFVEAAYIEKLVVTLARGGVADDTYPIEILPTYDAEKGFTIAAGNRYPFNITLSTTLTKAHPGNGIEVLGVVPL